MVLLLSLRALTMMVAVVVTFSIISIFSIVSLVLVTSSWLTPVFSYPRYEKFSTYLPIGISSSLNFPSTSVIAPLFVLSMYASTSTPTSGICVCSSTIVPRMVWVRFWALRVLEISIKRTR